MEHPQKRLDRLAKHLTAAVCANSDIAVPTPTSTAPVPLTDIAVPTPTSKAPVPLTVEQLTNFVRDGYLILQPPESEVPKAVHKTIWNNALKVLQDGGRTWPGNNIYPACPGLEHILASPTLKGALESVLGPGYLMHKHRALHNSTMQGDQDWHKDSYFGWRRMRSHRPRWAMAMYYPQDTVLEMGPTAILPGSQYWTVDHEDGPTRKFLVGEDRLSWDTVKHLRKQSGDNALTDSMNDRAAKSLDSELQERFAIVPAGSILLIHYDIFHRGSRRRAKGFDERFMFKFQFFRVNDPVPNSFPTLPAAAPAPNRSHAIHDEIHRFLGGSQSGPAPTIDMLPKLLSELHSTREPLRIGAAYSLGYLARESVGTAAGEKACASLSAALFSDAEAARRAGAFGLTAAGPQAVPLLLEALQAQADGPMRKYALHALGEIGDARKEVIAAMRVAITRKPPYTYEQTLEKATAAFALGLLGQAAHRQSSAVAFGEICDLLASAAVDDQAEVIKGSGKYPIREEATLGLLLLCAVAPRQIMQVRPQLIPLLANAAADEDRYVQGYANEALLSLAQEGSNSALESLFNAMLSNAAPEDEDTITGARQGLEAFAGGSDKVRVDVARLVSRQICARTNPRSPW